MPFLAKEQQNTPTTDILSWYFDSPSYPLDKLIYLDASCPETRYHTAASARTLIRKLCAGFTAHGLRPGDCVSLHSFNDVDYPIIVNGIVAFGGIFAGTNPAYTPHEMAHAIKAAKVGYMVVEKELLEVVINAAKDGGWVKDGEDVEEVVKRRVWIFDHDEQDAEAVPKGWRSWRELLQHGEKDWIRFDDLETAKRTEAARLFSSGTTGMPKAAMLSHYNLIGQHGLVQLWHPRPHEPIRLISTPLFHAALAPTAHFSALKNGVQSYIMRRFEIEPYLAYIEKYKITEGLFVPPLVIAIINSPQLTSKYSLASLKWCMCGAAPLSRGSQERFQKLMAPGGRFSQVWGMTETSCVAFSLPYPRTDYTGSVGIPCPGIDVKLVDVEDGVTDTSRADTRGEICVRGPTVVRGYLSNDEANRRDWDADGYFHTGDIGYMDGKTGLWYIVDRKKELIKVRGFQVAPPELEGVLMSHPRVLDCAVIGVPALEERDGEVPRAYCVLSPSKQGEKDIKPQEIADFLKGRLASYKQLKGGVVLVDVIPRNPSGKILKRILRDQVKAEMETEENEKAKL